MTRRTELAVRAVVGAAALAMTAAAAEAGRDWNSGSAFRAKHWNWQDRGDAARPRYRNRPYRQNFRGNYRAPMSRRSRRYYGYPYYGFLDGVYPYRSFGFRFFVPQQRGGRPFHVGPATRYGSRFSRGSGGRWR